MGKRGPQPRPTAQKKLEGNPGKRPLNENEPVPQGQATPPDYLDFYALQVWSNIITAMPRGLYTPADAELLAAYCMACSRHRQAVLELQKRKPVRFKKQKKSPWYDIEREQAQLKATLGTRLGLDPTARSAIDMRAMLPTGYKPDEAKPAPASKWGRLTAVNAPGKK